MQGKSINGYRLQKPLGTGGMAEVWYAENSLGKNAAVKFLKKELCGNPDIVERFRNEAQVMVKLNHPNIRQVYDYAELDGQPAIIMEYLEGDDLKTMLKRGHRFTDVELRKWWDQMVSALNYTHKKDVVHRDIKPSNIFIDTEGNVRLLDFGIAKVKESISSTQTGSTLGTLLYMSPEQIDDVKRVDYRTDVYSLAVTFVHLLTGKAPYDATTTSDYQIRKSIVEKPLDLTALPVTWSGFLTPYLAKDREQRPALKPFDASAASASSFASSSDEGTVIDTSMKLEPKPVSQPKTTPIPSSVIHHLSPRNPSPKKFAWLWVLLGVVVLVGGILVGVKGSRNDSVYYDVCCLDTIGVVMEEVSVDSEYEDQQICVEGPMDLSPYGSYSGTIGGSAAYMFINNTGEGTFSYNINGTEVKRIIHVQSYDKSSGRLVISEDDLNGNYIGRFEGHLSEDQKYAGDFINHKGAKALFKLSK